MPLHISFHLFSKQCPNNNDLMYAISLLKLKFYRERLGWKRNEKKKKFYRRKYFLSKQGRAAIYHQMSQIKIFQKNYMNQSKIPKSCHQLLHGGQWQTAKRQLKAHRSDHIFNSFQIMAEKFFTTLIQPVTKQ